MSAITIKYLVRDYGGGKGVFDLSFHVDQGEAFGFLGPNGVGKTTTIRHLMGFLKPESGKCTISGLDCRSERDRVQGRQGYIPGELDTGEGVVVAGALLLHPMNTDYFENQRNRKAEPLVVNVPQRVVENRLHHPAGTVHRTKEEAEYAHY